MQDIIESVNQMDLGIDCVEASNQRWVDTASAMLLDFLKTVQGPFTSDDFRRYAYWQGLAEPGHVNAWGSIYRRASQHRLILRVGNAPTRRIVGHARLLHKWIPAHLRPNLWTRIVRWVRGIFS
jgi:hypothetical protein